MKRGDNCDIDDNRQTKIPRIFTAHVRSTKEGTVFTGVCAHWRGVPPSLGLDGGTHPPPPPRSGLDGGTSPPPCQAAELAIATRRAVCLLRSQEDFPVSCSFDVLCMAILDHHRFWKRNSFEDSRVINLKRNFVMFNFDLFVPMCFQIVCYIYFTRIIVYLLKVSH